MLITFEGIEGSGKTTQLEYIVEYLVKKGIKSVITKEPGGTKIGENIRSILLDPKNGLIDPLTELLLYCADRAQHIKQFILPMMNEGKIVLCDRFHDSTIVYQGFARGLDADLIKQLNALILGNLRPDKTFLLDLPPEVGLRRAWSQINHGNRPDTETRFEKESMNFHQKIRDGYLKLSKSEPERFVIIDASGDVATVKEQILKEIEALIKRDKL